MLFPVDVKSMAKKASVCAVDFTINCSLFILWAILLYKACILYRTWKHDLVIVKTFSSDINQSKNVGKLPDYFNFSQVGANPHESE